MPRLLVFVEALVERGSGRTNITRAHFNALGVLGNDLVEIIKRHRGAICRPEVSEKR